MEGGLSREASEGAKRRENSIASGWMNLMYIYINNLARYIYNYIYICSICRVYIKRSNHGTIYTVNEYIYISRYLNHKRLPSPATSPCKLLTHWTRFVCAAHSAGVCDELAQRVWHRC